jgi:hypothetical protein
MQQTPSRFDTPLDTLSWPEWVQATRPVTGTAGFTENLGPRHAAIFVENPSKTLLVSFEAHHRIEDLSEKGHPLGWALVEALGWSHLCLASEMDTWFRENLVYGFFDRLIDEGFFERFDTVLFYGAGSCGYAAAAFSVAAPGARVLAIQPQATLDPRVAEWDNRFIGMRRTSFDDRFGYAPDMLDAAQEAFVLYDPDIELDAMHAALFTRPNVTKFRMRHLGPRIDASLVRMKVLLRMLAQLSAGKLSTLALARLYRARRTDGAYQYGLLMATTRDDRHQLTAWLAHAVLRQRGAPPFRKALARATNMLAAQDPSHLQSGLKGPAKSEDA